LDQRPAFEADVDQLERERARHSAMKRPGLVVGLVLITTALGFLGYSFMGAERMERTAETVGRSTDPKEANQPSDQAGRSRPDPEMRDTRGPPATAR
jgi:hypothetical protein